ncbi:ABC transporter substrate-binding protein [Actinophytocola xinjiangensis]|uniref:ABC transporter substrate-binding protein n=1 Tax=Actinophytocola xinjiangensis TaxID=485602 RepID=A0A7Z1AYY8_9PSEU|nr:ABC transporter substrate-binding protein [Actinophytocola xinjiangensis]OLF09788.1 ABC transporter substrate-binding protein [Actinophytocola xinjiangensis]
MRTLVVLAVAALTATLAPVARAVDHSKGYPGYCRNATGVTVVVDFQQLGGTTIVRCDPRPTRGTGLDAVKGAGFQIEGVVRWGEGFICRIENRPSAVEEIPVAGDDGYREACRDTPPASAYWSYWHAGNNCQWEYSQWGVKNRDFVPGGFEGWSFSLNATADTNPTPRIAAVRPGTTGQPCDAPDEPEPTTADPNARQPGAAGAQNGAGGGSGGSTETSTAPGRDALPPPKPRTGSPDRAEADDPSGNVAFTGGEKARDVTEVVREQSGASDYAPWAAGGAVVLLGLATWLTARRRKRSREA